MINRIKMRFIQCFIFFFAIGLLMVGVLNQEYEAVYRKAINICLECIGIG
ncbi:hypothetical protein JCM11672_24060 [Alkaliphilus crotonatoxidans]